MTNITLSAALPLHGALTFAECGSAAAGVGWCPLRAAGNDAAPGNASAPAGSPARRVAAPDYPGRTTPRIGIDPAPANVTWRPGRGAWTIVPSPTYMATWLASLK